MATVVKNFRIKSGLIVEGTTGTINGQNILTESGGDQYILNLVGGATLVKSVDTNVFNVNNAGNLTVNANTFDSYGSASSAQSAAATDATNKANAALASAQTYADSAASTAQSAAISAASADATSKANAALSDAEDYADGLISTEVTNRNNAISSAISDEVSDRNSAISSAITNLNLAGTYDALGAAANALADANTYTDGKVADLVDSAPALLNTLNELAAAIADNPNYASDVANLVATKADTTYVDGEISSLDTAAQGYASTAQSNAQSFATTAANNAQSAAEDYADSLASNYDAAGSAATAQSNAETFATNAANAAQSAAEATAAADATTKANAAQAAAEATAQAALDNVLDGSTQFTAVNIAGYTRQVGQWTNAGTAGAQVTAYSYSTGWGSAEFLVRVMSNAAGHQHSQLSKVLVTTDGAGNVAVTEYGIVTTNGNMGDVTADISGGNVRILVTPQYASSEVIVSGTLLAYND